MGGGGREAREMCVYLFTDSRFWDSDGYFFAGCLGG
jgi:hypothetical protein